MLCCGLLDVPKIHKITVLQSDMFYFEAKEDNKVGREDEDFFAGIGQVGYNATQEHFPQLWCPDGNYSMNGQVADFAEMPQMHNAVLLCLRNRSHADLALLPCVATAMALQNSLHH